MTIYDNQFNQNEWYVIALILGYFIFLFLPRRFPLQISIVFVLYGLAIGSFWDQLIAFPPFDLFDANDSSYYDLFDFLLYCGFGPYSYLMVYIFDWLKLQKKHLTFYVLLMSVIGVGAEWLGIKFGVFHYKNGYHLYHSFPIYLVSYSVLFMLYFKLYKLSDER